MNDYDYDTYPEEYPLLEEDDDDDELSGDFLDDYGSDDDDDEAAERRRRFRRWRRRKTPRTARGRGYYRRRPSKKPATKGQLKDGLARASTDIKQNAAAIKKVNSRVNSLGSTHSKDTKKLKKELKQSRDMSLFPLLFQGPGQDSMLPLVLMLTMGGSSSDMMLPLMLVMMNQPQSGGN